MGIFSRKQSQEEPKLSPEQREVAGLDEWIGSLSPEKQRALGGFLLGLMPHLVKEMRGNSPLLSAFEELGEQLKTRFKRLLFRLTSPQSFVEALGGAFMTHAPNLRNIASAAAAEYLQREREVEQLRAERKQVIDADVAPAPPALEPIR